MRDRVLDPRSLYLHIPFCVSKCPYCDFNSHVGLENLFDGYRAALDTEIRAWAREQGRLELDTVFLGGGTPSRVPAAHIAAVLDTVREVFQLCPDAEITLEANPQSADADKMEAWLEAGVNRLSLGFQSLDAEALGFLERAHSADEAVSVFARARRAGFTNVSCDLIFAMPGLSTEAWRSTLGRVIALSPDHISAYELTPEPGTRLGQDVAAGRTLMPPESVQLEQYEIAAQVLRVAGYERYEVSNWARPGRECRHNIAYWSGVPYIGAGAGAHAYLRTGAHPGWLEPDRAPGSIAVRQWNVRHPAAYIAAVRSQGNAAAGHEWLDQAQSLGELMMMGLRRDAGIDPAAAQRLFGVDPRIEFEPQIRQLVNRGLLEAGSGPIRTTPRGQRVLNAVAAEFIAA